MYFHCHLQGFDKWVHFEVIHSAMWTTLRRPPIPIPLSVLYGYSQEWQQLQQILNSYRGYKRWGGGGPTISHLFFADDALFFFKATETSFNSLNSLLHRFCNISGQIVNLQKSFVKLSPNTPGEHQLSYKNKLRMESRDNMGQYLGLPVDIQDKKVQHFTYLLDLISSKLSAWGHRCLSQSQKLIIINSILVASLNHVLAVFKIPATITNKINGLLASFFWGSHQQSGIH